MINVNTNDYEKITITNHSDTEITFYNQNDGCWIMKVHDTLIDSVSDETVDNLLFDYVCRKDERIYIYFVESCGSIININFAL